MKNKADRIMRTNEVMEVVGCSRTTLWEWERKGHFPSRRRIGPRAVGWFCSEVESFLNSRERAGTCSP